MRTGRLFLDNKELEEQGLEKHVLEEEKKVEDGTNKVCFADLKRHKSPGSINISYMGESPRASANLSSWASQQHQERQYKDDSSIVKHIIPDGMAYELNNVRLKLEQRRKHIEEEKKKMENIMDGQQREMDAGGDLPAVQSPWLSNSRGPPRRASEPLDMETYAKNLHAMNDSLHHLQTDIQRLAQQQSQIQQMMQQQRQQQQSPMDPQPFFISEGHHPHHPPPPPPPQRRTWGQPQPINFAHQLAWTAHNHSRRQQWGQQHRPIDLYHGYGPQSSDHDPYSVALPHPSRPAVGGSLYEQQRPDMYGYGYQQSAQHYGSAYISPPSVNSLSRTPFRLHDSRTMMSPPQMSSPSTTMPRTSFFDAISETSSPQRTTSSATSTMQTSHNAAANYSHLQSSIPAPQEDDMAPQNVSFIESSAEEKQQNDVESEESPAKKLPERLSQLHISSGTKTYRIHSDDITNKDTTATASVARPTISSTFKQNYSSGAESTGPSSLGQSSHAARSEQEEETLVNMKTERLKEDKDTAAGFVISFDESKPRKAKPALKPRKPSLKNGIDEVIMSSDGSNSSRKENVPPEDLGSDDADDLSPYRKRSSLQRRKSNARRQSNSSALEWQSFDAAPDTDHQQRFEIDPDVPLEKMAIISAGTPTSESSEGQQLVKAVIIGDELLHADPNVLDEMQRKKEKIMLQSLKRKQQQEEKRLRREEENRRKELEEQGQDEVKARKKEEDKIRREAILEQHRLKKEMEKMEEERGSMPQPVSARPVPKLHSSNAVGSLGRTRPKTIHIDQEQENLAGSNLRSSRGSRGSSSNISGSRHSLSHDPPRVGLSSVGTWTSQKSARPGSRRGSNTYINEDYNAKLPPSGLSNRSMEFAARQAAAARKKQSRNSDVEDSPRVSRLDRSTRSVSQPRGRRDSSVSSAYGVRDYRGSRESLNSGLTYNPRRRGSIHDEDYYYGGSLRDLSTRAGGRKKCTSASHLGPGSLPGYRRRSDYDDGASDISSTSGFSAYGYRSGTHLYREPASKSNRSIILNAIEYAVFPGVVNGDTRKRVLDVIDRCDCTHFLLLFRDQKCQFRGLYAYYPDTEEVYKIYGTGPKQVMDRMFEHFFKYNSGGKKFTKIHTKHLTVTIDAFTIHNSLWLGKKAKLPDKRDMALVV